MERNDDDKPTKKTKYSQCYISKYDTIPGISKSQKGTEYAFCKYCSRDVDISHGGENDLKKHIQTKMHEKNARILKSSVSIVDSFKSSVDRTEMLTTNAEAIWSELIAHLNIPLSSADLITKTIQVTFKGELHNQCKHIV